MNKLLISVVLAFLCFKTNAQAGQWTWMKGDSTGNPPSVFGTMGISSPLNTPPALYEAAEFKDTLGNFWLFGGENHNALWKFNPSLNEWTWMKGSSLTNNPGSYGTQGIPSISNNPPYRGLGIATWVDLNGDLWLFGGTGVGSYSDLWRYQISSNEWTWMKGPNSVGQPGSYGIQGQPSASNYPPARWESNASWVDDSGNLWLFGGYSGNGILNDLWKYDPLTNMWTWMKGSNSINPPGIYGTQGIEDAMNTPGGRLIYSKWKDKDGNFWLFGGLDYGISNEAFNDMWKYNVATGNWVWMAGSNTLNSAGSYGNNCVGITTDIPPSRYENRAAWVDSCGNFWLFGGRKNYAGDALNDLWKFDPVTILFTWVSGDNIPNQVSHYGIQTVSGPDNKPGSHLGAISWIDNDGDLWFFGGVDHWPGDDFNAMWRYRPDSSCGGCFFELQSPVSIASSDQTVCEKYCVSYYDSSSNNPTGWQWIFEGGDPSSSTDQNPSSICYNIPGFFDVTLITTSATGSDTLTLNNYITVNATPPFPTITQNGYTLTSSPAYSYQWQLNAADIAGATNQSYTVLQSGYYTVIAGDSNGCVNSSSQYILISGIHDRRDEVTFSIFPNPMGDQLTLQSSSLHSTESITVSIINLLGQIVEKQRITWNDSGTLDVGNLPPGVYLLTVENKREKFVTRFVKE